MHRRHSRYVAVFWLGLSLLSGIHCDVQFVEYGGGMVLLEVSHKPSCEAPGVTLIDYWIHCIQEASGKRLECLGDIKCYRSDKTMLSL